MVILHDREVVVPRRLRAMVHQDRVAKQRDMVPSHSHLIFTNHRHDKHSEIAHQIDRVHDRDKEIEQTHVTSFGSNKRHVRVQSPISPLIR